MKNWKLILPVALGIHLLALSLPESQTFPQSAALDRTTSNILAQTSRALNEIAARTAPAVVSISSIRLPDSRISVDGPAGNSNSSNKSSSDLQDPEDAWVGIGSGIIIRPEGVILTNDHVVQNSERVMVTLNNLVKAPAHVIGSDPKTDLAVIRLDQPPKKPLTTLRFGNSDQIEVGDWIIAVGSPFGLNQSVTSGIVSAKGRGQLGMLDTEDFIQTDAAINPGNSGGPLLNTQGEVIGINTAIFSQNGGFMGIGFAIPSQIAKEVVAEILQHGRVIRGWIGISTQDVDKDLADFFHVKPHQGALVSDIQPNGPGFKADLKIGDIVFSYDQIPVDSARHLKALVAKTRQPKQVVLQIVREGAIEEHVTLVREQPRPQLAGQAAPKKLAQHHPFLGITVQDIPPDLAKILGFSHSGAIVTDIKMGSPAFDAGITRGDIILEANKTKVHNSRDFKEALKKNSRVTVTVLYVQRGPDDRVFIPIRSKIS